MKNSRATVRLSAPRRKLPCRSAKPSLGPVATEEADRFLRWLTAMGDLQLFPRGPGCA